MGANKMKKIFDYLLEQTPIKNISYWRLSESEKTLFAYDTNNNLVLKERVEDIV